MYTFDCNFTFSTTLSQIYYDSFISDMGENVIMFSGRDSVDYIVIGDLDEKLYSHSFLRKKRKAELEEMACYYGVYGGYGDTKGELIDELLYIDQRTHHKRLHDDVSWRDLDYDFIVRGYSQGDAIKVVILDPDKYCHIDSDYLRNIFYDLPVDGVITIYKDNKAINELYYYDVSDDDYRYDKDKVISTLSRIEHEYTPSLVLWAKDNLPDQLDYR